MKKFAALLNALYYTYSNNAKLALLINYFQTTPDPDRGYALAVIAGTLNFTFFKRGLIQTLLTEEIDPVLFKLSYDYVGDFSETAALLWPYYEDAELPQLSEIVRHFGAANKAEIKNYLTTLLNHATPIERWALLKLGTGSLRIGVSARFIKQALANFADKTIHEIEEVWHAVQPPYEDLFAWLEHKADKPVIEDKIYFHPVMLAHPLDDEKDLIKITAQDYAAEWKYDGIRVQLVSTSHGKALFSRSGDDISHAFPDVLSDFNAYAVLDGELVIKAGEHIGSFNELQQRLNRKSPTKKMLAEFPAHIILYDALSLELQDIRQLHFAERRAALNDWYAKIQPARMSLSPILPYQTGADLKVLRQTVVDNPHTAIEGLMLKKLTSTYQAGRPTGQWYKWKRDPFLVDAVLMYAQRGHGKRASFYSDFTFGLWQEKNILPIGKAYFGFTDEELKLLDRWVRTHTIKKFGPVCEVEKALVFEIAFEAVQKSPRHKSGFALRFPRINRIRWDKPAEEADSLTHLENLLNVVHLGMKL